MDAAQRSPVYALAKTVPGRAAAAPGVPHHADGLVHPAAVAGGRPAHRDRARRRGPQATCSARSTRCASPSSTWPSCSPRATPRRSTGCCARSPRCARTCATSPWTGPRDESIAAAVGMTGERARTRCTGCWHRQVRGPLRHPHRLRGPDLDTAHQLEELGVLPRLRRRPRHGRQRAVRRGVGQADAGGGGDVPRAAGTADQRPDRRSRPARRPGQPAQLGRQRPPRRAVPGPHAERAAGAGDARAPRRRTVSAGRLGVPAVPRRGPARAARPRCGARSRSCRRAVPANG